MYTSVSGNEWLDDNHKMRKQPSRNGTKTVLWCGLALVMTYINFCVLLTQYSSHQERRSLMTVMTKDDFENKYLIGMTIDTFKRKSREDRDSIIGDLWTQVLSDLATDMLESIKDPETYFQQHSQREFLTKKQTHKNIKALITDDWDKDELVAWITSQKNADAFDGLLRMWENHAPPHAAVVTSVPSGAVPLNFPPASAPPANAGLPPHPLIDQEVIVVETLGLYDSALDPDHFIIEENATGVITHVQDDHAFVEFFTGGANGTPRTPCGQLWIQMRLLHEFDATSGQVGKSLA